MAGVDVNVVLFLVVVVLCLFRVWMNVFGVLVIDWC